MILVDLASIRASLDDMAGVDDWIRILGYEEAKEVIVALKEIVSKASATREKIENAVGLKNLSPKETGLDEVRATVVAWLKSQYGVEPDRGSSLFNEAHKQLVSALQSERWEKCMLPILAEGERLNLSKAELSRVVRMATGKSIEDLSVKELQCVRDLLGKMGECTRTPRRGTATKKRGGTPSTPASPPPCS